MVSPPSFPFLSFEGDPVTADAEAVSADTQLLRRSPLLIPV